MARLGGGHMKYSVPTGPPVGKHCEFCSSPHHVGGPVWIDKMHCTVRALNEPSRSCIITDKVPLLVESGYYRFISEG